MVGEEVSLRQDCKQAIYRALKNPSFALINGENLSQNNIENPNPTIDQARQEGARFVIIADVQTNPLSALPGTTSPFKSYRARANLRVYSTNNYAVVAEGADLQTAACGGEDYKLLLTADGTRAEALAAAYREQFGRPLYPVGRITAATGLVWLRNGAPETLDWHGFEHF